MYTLVIIAIVLFVLRSKVSAIYKWYKNRRRRRSDNCQLRGTYSERELISKLLRYGIPPVTLYHDLYVELSDGQYSQVDAVLLTRVGIIVLEVKDYSGWLFGKGYQEYWTQVMAYGKSKVRFYNPVMQNKGHIGALRRRLAGMADVPYFSVIVFAGSCIFKDVSHIPSDTRVIYFENIIPEIENIIQNNPPANYKDKRGVVNALNECVANGDDKNIVNGHIRNLRQKYG
ncbi:MAG: NERD domain-containing protein [Duncaniella sp.]|nr:NERD domain-containing protein [Duncaniella sp.]